MKIFSGLCEGVEGTLALLPHSNSADNLSTLFWAASSFMSTERTDKCFLISSPVQNNRGKTVACGILNGQVSEAFHAEHGNDLRANAPAALRPFLSAFPVLSGRDLGNGLASYTAGFLSSGRFGRRFASGGSVVDGPSIVDGIVYWAPATIGLNLA